MDDPTQFSYMSNFDSYIVEDIFNGSKRIKPEILHSLVWLWISFQILKTCMNLVIK